MIPLRYRLSAIPYTSCTLSMLSVHAGAVLYRDTSYKLAHMHVTDPV